MRRRGVITLLGAAAVLPGAVLAQQGGKPVIGYLVLSNPEPGFAFFKAGLQKLGYVDGKTIRIEFRNAEGKPERLAALATELTRLKVDVLVTAQTPAATAAKLATSTIPIVMAAVGDPLATGLIANYARPGGNVTGIAGATTQVTGKTLELIREMLPSAKRLTVLANATDPFTRPFLQQLQASAPALGFEMAAVSIRDTAEMSGAFAEMARRRTDAVIVQPSLQRRAAAKLALERRVPAVSPNGQFPSEGGLLGYSAAQADMYRESAAYVDRILRGAKPADLPVQQASRFELTLNLKTAQALGVSVPRALVLRADKVIE